MEGEVGPPLAGLVPVKGAVIGKSLPVLSVGRVPAGPGRPPVVDVHATALIRNRW